MRFVWVQDLDFVSNPYSGGAQASDWGHYQYGLKKGHEQILITPQNWQSVQVQGEDVLILSNIRSFGPERFLDKPNKIITFNHDYWCRYRLFYPRLEKCIKSCAYKEPWEKLFKKAKLNIFLSPLHYKMHKEVFGDAIEPHALVPSPVDPEKFYDMKKEREKDVLTVNTALPFKGKANLIAWANNNPDRKITVVGARSDVPLPSNCEYIGVVPYAEMPELYNKHKFYLELPSTPQPMNRTACEAYLCGCSLITNNLLGFMSWGWKLRDDVRGNVGSNASKRFWKSIEKVIV